MLGGSLARAQPTATRPAVGKQASAPATKDGQRNGSAALPLPGPVHGADRSDQCMQHKKTAQPSALARINHAPEQPSPDSRPPWRKSCTHHAVGRDGSYGTLGLFCAHDHNLAVFAPRNERLRAVVRDPSVFAQLGQRDALGTFSLQQSTEDVPRVAAQVLAALDTPIQRRGESLDVCKEGRQVLVVEGQAAEEEAVSVGGKSARGPRSASGFSKSAVCLVGQQSGVSQPSVVP